MKTLLRLAVIAALAAPATLSAQGFAVAAHAGSLGVGGSLIFPLTESVNARGTFGVIPSSPTATAEGIDFTLDFPAFARATLDYYPTGFFYLSAGGLFVTKSGDITVTGEFSGTQDFGGTTYTAAEVGDLVGVFSLKSFMPYVGIGFGNPTARRVGLGLDLGVALGEVPTVDLDATGPIASDQTFQANLAAEEADIQADIPDLLKYYPVVNLYLSIGFPG